MYTEILQVHPQQPENDAIARAAALLRGGRLVAFPTETVYGLGANALDATACAGIFTAKGRPPTNPVIVHVASPSEAKQIVAAWPETADRLAARFWPGPLTIVLPKKSSVPDIITAGRATVAVRVPAHPVALALLREASIPVAAPSANISGQLSPTRAEHVLHDLNGRIDLVLDAGPCPGGLESTVLDLTQRPPRLLRPGLIGPSEIEELIGLTERSTPAAAPDQPLPSPGMLARHYAPRAPLECITGNAAVRVAELIGQGLRVGWLKLGGNGGSLSGVIQVAMPRDPLTYAARLYAELHALDDAGVDRSIVELPPDTEEWLTIRDRLRRASAP
jgi:L-threonylcarbamoyladenylate synthase